MAVDQSQYSLAQPISPFKIARTIRCCQSYQICPLRYSPFRSDDVEIVDSKDSYSSVAIVHFNALDAIKLKDRTRSRRRIPRCDWCSKSSILLIKSGTERRICFGDTHLRDLRQLRLLLR